LENQYRELLSKVNAGEKCVMQTYLDRANGVILDKLLITTEDLQNKDLSITDDVRDKISLALDTGNIGYYELEDTRTLIIEPFISKPRLIIFGGGHISKPLTELAARTGFSVIVVDDRLFFANNERFPEAEEIICESFEHSFHKIGFRNSDYVVIVTRGHRYDGIVIREVLNHQLHYIGMIGSKRRVKGMMEELANEGYSREKLEQVKSPIGIEIAAITPDEIAISIVAQLIEIKNKGSINQSGKTFHMPEFDAEVLEKILEVSPIPKALITILSSKGSVPRKSGAKMIAYYDGRSIGSIGGGCSEAAVLTRAREIMLTKGCSIEHVDMTGEVAESEGMVCGGVMEVLVEAI